MELVALKSPISPEQYAADMAEYVEAGRSRALALGSRGPLRLTDDGKLDPAIRDAYSANGFYIFENVIRQGELAELRRAVEELLGRAPVEPEAPLDAMGRPATKSATFLWSKPLADPWGGTDIAGGRHPTKMTEPEPPVEAPEQVVSMIQRMCEARDEFLRLYGNPELLAVAEAINGPDFVPYNDVIFVKPPGLGFSVSWHQDGITHWDASDWDEEIHGFNFQVQLYRCTPANCLWVVPGTHRQGKIDIRQMVADNGGSDRLPQAVPLICEAGDVTIVNRQTLHGSFANTTADPRVSITFGFHRCASVLGQHVVLSGNPDQVCDEERIFRRSSVIAVAIDARARHFPEERRFRYQPFAQLEEQFRWNDDMRSSLVNYNANDLSI